MPTIKNLTEENRKLSKEKVDLSTAHPEEGEYVKLKERIRTMERDHWKSIQPRLAEIRKRQDQIALDIESLKRPKEAVPEKAEEMLRRIRHGIEDGVKWRIHCATPTHAIVHKPGGTGWSGRGMTSYYAAEYCVYPISATSFSDVIAKVEGRLTKAKLAELMAVMT